VPFCKFVLFEEKSLLDSTGELLLELVEILTEIFNKFATEGRLEEEGATRWVMK
jgi:hypothetical protein